MGIIEIFLTDKYRANEIVYDEILDIELPILYKENRKQTKNVWAKIIDDQGLRKYLIKSRSGGKFYDPLSAFESRTIGRHRDPWVFRSVPEKTFKLYCRFLIGLNKTMLRHAEREC